MNILITGAKGFIGKNLIAQLKNIKEGKAKEERISSDLTLLKYTRYRTTLLTNIAR